MTATLHRLWDLTQLLQSPMCEKVLNSDCAAKFRPTREHKIYIVEMGYDSARAAASQFSALFQRTTDFADWHMDAERRSGVACI